MDYGYFDDKNREYVLKTPKTPIKWINYMGTLEFGGVVDNTGGTLLCKKDPALNRITKYIAQLPNSDFKGSTIYVRFKDKRGNYKFFSPFYTPTLKPLNFFEHRVGLSYSKWIVEAYGLRVTITIFIPQGAKTLLQDIQVENLGDSPQQVDIIPVYEFSHFDALKQLINADWVPQTMQVDGHRDKKGYTVLRQSAFMKKGVEENFLTASIPFSSYETDRSRFLGEHGYGSWAKPLSLFNKDLGQGDSHRGEVIGALLLPLGEISLGEEKRVVTQLSQKSSLEEALIEIEKYRNLEEVDRAKTELSQFWKTYLSALQVKTPDASFNTMVNIHNPRQCHTTKNWSRYLSLYQLGYGARGIGFRDSSQDLVGVISHMPEEGREFMEKLLQVQKSDGSAMHQFFPLTMEANEGDSLEEPDRPDYYGDDHLWIIQSVSQYLKESGNLAFLDKKIPYYGEDSEGQKVTPTVWQHLQQAIEFTQAQRGANGLPLLGFADWNDTVNLPKGAESLFVANLYAKGLLEMIDICQATGKGSEKERYESYYRQMKEAVNQAAWDGQWYIRYIKADGQPIGSHKNTYGQIYTNGQSWPVISGLAEKERAEIALESVYNHLNTSSGIKLSTPGYNGFDPELGGVSTYPPGAKENGGIFLHANPWVMIAETLMGNGDRAFQYYCQINPASKNDILDTFESEPYCYPQNILGDEHPQFGLGRNAWLSGTASWAYVAATQYILGVKPSFNGLMVNPCIPKSWQGFRVVRQFRGATYHIEVKNPEHICKGVKSILVDNKPHKGKALPLFSEGDHYVEVVLGSVK